jgi:predicted AAA+ superfamily ATPase
MNTNKLYPRFAAEKLKEALADTPAVLIHGPRQSGKTTLARAVGEPLGYSYFSFDDPALADAAKSDPIGFVDDLPERTILDEVSTRHAFPRTEDGYTACAGPIPAYRLG